MPSRESALIDTAQKIGAFIDDNAALLGPNVAPAGAWTLWGCFAPQVRPRPVLRPRAGIWSECQAGRMH